MRYEVKCFLQSLSNFLSLVSPIFFPNPPSSPPFISRFPTLVLSSRALPPMNDDIGFQELQYQAQEIQQRLKSMEESQTQLLKDFKQDIINSLNRFKPNFEFDSGTPKSAPVSTIPPSLTDSSPIFQNQPLFQCSPDFHPNFSLELPIQPSTIEETVFEDYKWDLGILADKKKFENFVGSIPVVFEEDLTYVLPCQVKKNDYVFGFWLNSQLNSFGVIHDYSDLEDKVILYGEGNGGNESPIVFIFDSMD